MTSRLSGAVAEEIEDAEQRMGVQIFIATHDYGILKDLDLQGTKGDKIAYHSFHRDSGDGEITCHKVRTYLDIHPNAIAEAFADPYGPGSRAQPGERRGVTTLTEGNLRIAFPVDMSVKKLDSPEPHGLTHCMKAVDFIVEDDDRVLFIEFKDPDHPRARDEDRGIFVQNFSSGRLIEDLKYKYRDTFLYEWMSGNVRKPVY